MLRSIARFLFPRAFRRQKREQLLAQLRQRDGENCRRCRRPIRFDRPAGHDLGARIELIRRGSADSSEGLDNLCLTHGRCNVKTADRTAEVHERLRPRREAELFIKARKRRRAA